MSKKNKTICWLIVFVSFMLCFILITTYAYLKANEKYIGDFNVDVSSKGIDTFKMSSSGKIDLEANFSNFSKVRGDNISGEIILNTELYTTNLNANYCYEVNFILPDDKIFSYSKENVPELVLDIYKSEDGKEYESVISKMDITTKTGIIKVPISNNSNSYINKITTVKRIAKNNYWKAVVSLLYYDDIDQEINNNKTYSARFKANIVKCN